MTERTEWPCAVCGATIDHRTTRQDKTVCYACSRRRSITSTRARVPSPALIQQAATVAVAGLERATALGHTMSLEEDADPATWIAECDACTMYMCVDLEESPLPYGLSVTERCTGSRQYAAAVRRDLMMMDTALAVAGHERANNHPPRLPDSFRDKEVPA